MTLKCIVGMEIPYKIENDKKYIQVEVGGVAEWYEIDRVEECEGIICLAGAKIVFQTQNTREEIESILGI